MVGLLGADGGLIWIVAGVWSVRAAWSRPPGLAWGIACLGAGARWGVVSLAGIESAVRMFGPTVLVGLPIVRAGMTVAAVAALCSEARIDGLRAASWAERASALVALIVLVAAFAAPGPGEPSIAASLLWWALAGAGAVVLTLTLTRYVARLPMWLPAVVSGVGVMMALVV